MSQQIIDDLLSFLAQPGEISKLAWDTTYLIVTERSVPQDKLIRWVISVCSRVARARKVRLPDALHNIMVLHQSAPEEGNYQDILRNKKTNGYISSYLKMVAKLPSLEETQSARNKP